MKLVIVIVTTIALTLLICSQAESRRHKSRSHSRRGSRNKKKSEEHVSKSVEIILNVQTKSKPPSGEESFAKFLKSSRCENSPVYQKFMIHYKDATSLPGLSPIDRGDNYSWLKNLAIAVKDEKRGGSCPTEPPCKPRTKPEGRSINQSRTNSTPAASPGKNNKSASSIPNNSTTPRSIPSNETVSRPTSLPKSTTTLSPNVTSSTSNSRSPKS